MRSSVALLLCGFAALGVTGVRAVPSTALGQPSEHVALDGDLDAPAWRGAPSITLVQQNPSPGKPTPFTTTVRLLRDGGHLYLGIRCADPQPAKIAVHTLQRDLVDGLQLCLLRPGAGSRHGLPTRSPRI